MMDDLSAPVWDRLRCVECRRPLRRTPEGAVCTHCGRHYPRTKDGSLDMRLQAPQSYSLEFMLVPEAPTEHSFTSVPLQANPAPQVDFAGLPVPRHLTPEILSYFPKARGAESLMLDLGCGEAVHKQVAEQAGFAWVGLDYGARRAPILGDAQAIPFEDGSFEFVLCVTVLQYVQFPFVAMRDAFRVLKPGGVMIGSAAFLEPSHGTSFYHPSHVGIYNLLTDAGFTVRKIAPFATWPALKALASMGLFYRMPRSIAQALVAPLQLLHAAWWRFGGLVARQDLENDRLNHFAGSFSFIASRDV